MKIFLALCLPFGLLINVVYMIVTHCIGEIPDSIAYPMMIVSIVFMLIGIAYHGYCFGKRRSPYKFK